MSPFFFFSPGLQFTVLLLNLVLSDQNVRCDSPGLLPDRLILPGSRFRPGDVKTFKITPCRWEQIHASSDSDKNVTLRSRPLDVVWYMCFRVPKELTRTCLFPTVRDKISWRVDCDVIWLYCHSRCLQLRYPVTLAFIRGLLMNRRWSSPQGNWGGDLEGTYKNLLGKIEVFSSLSGRTNSLCFSLTRV